MESIIQYFQSIGLDIMYLVKIGIVLLLGTFLVSLAGRFVFGKKSALGCAVSTSFAILFVYILTIFFNVNALQQLVRPLPFVTLDGDFLYFFQFQGQDYTTISAQLLSMLILSFLVNIAGIWLPKGENLFTWLFFRCITVVLAFALHLIAVTLFVSYLPYGIVVYAPVILLGILVLLLLTGSLKLLVGVILTSVNPLIGALYTFFFATVVGKQIRIAVLTTAILSGLLFALNSLGCAVLYIGSAALIAYIPFLLILITLWYLTTKLF